MGKHIQWRDPQPREPRSYGEIVHYGGRRDGGNGYLAHSDRVGPGVLVIHEGYGLQPSWTAFADSLTDEGFTVLAPDLFDGDVADSLEAARALGSGLDRERTRARLHAAGEFLRDNWHPRVGIVGFSLGAMLGIELAASGFGDALVVYYGMPDEMPASLDVPVLVHLAGADEIMAPADAAAAFDELRERAADIEVLLHPEVRHSFANPSVPGFDATAASAAFERTCDFLHHHLA